MSGSLKTISAQVYDRLRREVLMGSLAPGEWVRELDIATSLSVSRTPVREAVHRLSQEGLLEVARNRGVRVRNMTLKDVLDAYEVREVLEGTAARRAAELIDDDGVAALEACLEEIARTPPGEVAAHIIADDRLHSTIVEVAGNAALVDVARLINGRVTRAKMLTSDTNAGELTRSQHRRIVDAIAARSASEAEEAMREHIRTYRDVVNIRLKGSGGVQGESSALRQTFSSLVPGGH